MSRIRVKHDAMTCVGIAIVAGLSILAISAAALNPDGTKCGQKICATTEYCSPFDSQCRPCSAVCDPASHNHQPEVCVKDCQEYLHDVRYVLRSDLSGYENLREEVNRLRTLLKVTLSLTCLAILTIIYLLLKAFVRWEKVRDGFRKIFSENWSKARSKNKVRDDVESGPAKQNGLKLTMPTISATVVTGRSSENGNGTPNTTSTPLSKRHPSEDTTLDYAYDNPAMTPSPEAAHEQIRTKRESSF